MTQNIERRAFQCDLRTAPESPNTVVGYAAVFNSLSVDLGGFRERLRQGAFASALASSDLDVTANIDHNNSRLLDLLNRFDTASGTIREKALKALGVVTNITTPQKRDKATASDEADQKIKDLEGKLDDWKPGS